MFNKSWAGNTQKGKKGFQPTSPKLAQPSTSLDLSHDDSISLPHTESLDSAAAIDEVYDSYVSSLAKRNTTQLSEAQQLERRERLKNILWQGPPSQSGDLPPKIPLVVYGTLRKGEELDDGVLGGSHHEETEDGEEIVRETAYLKGKMYKSTEGDWPLLDTKEQGWITCEIVSMDSDPEKGAWNKMGTDEIGWGYSLEYVNIYDSPNGEPVGTALVCTWPWDHHKGEHISSGDWLNR